MPNVTSAARMFFGKLLGHVNGAAKFLDRLDDVVCGHHHHDGLRIVARHQCGAQADACRRVAAAGLADDALAW